MLEQVRVAGVERGQRQSKAQFFSCVNVIDKAVTARGYCQREDITPGADPGFFNGGQMIPFSIFLGSRYFSFVFHVLYFFGVLL